jgi:RHS repeat-associated protein
MQTYLQNKPFSAPTFGSPINSRAFACGEYRFGMNGQEKDDEIKGSGNSVAFEARIYDQRLGRFLSVDPLARVFVFESNYVFVSNNPSIYIDIEGKSKYLTIIEINEKTGENTQIRVLIDNKVLEQVYDNQLGVENFAYYDINEVHKTVIDKEGNKSTEIYTERGAYRAKTLLPSKIYANLVKTDTEEEKKLDKGLHGIRWTTSSGGSVGQGNSKESGRRYERSENIDLLLTLFNQTKTTASMDKGPVTVASVLKMIKSIWDTGKDISDGMKKIEDAQKEVQQYDSNGHGCSSCSEARHGTFDYHDRSGNEINGTTGDTTNKKKNEKTD